MILEDGSAVAVHAVDTAEVCVDFIAPRTSHSELEFMRVTLNKGQVQWLADELLKHSKGLHNVQ